MNVEKWQAIPDWSGFYSVSSLGRVRSEARIVERSDGKRQPIPERILRPTVCGKRLQYERVTLARDGKTHFRYVHRLIAEVFGAESC